MKEYDHKKIEEKWQKKWEKEGLYKTSDDFDKPKEYVLDMFPYPSGEGLHIGHPKGYIASDIYSRYKKMLGFNVLHPMGFDAFGLPAENYALKNKVHPMRAVEKNIARYKKQLSIIGFNYDWDREINTTDPEYYKWTQWIFLELFKHGLAYESNEPINWCPSCKTGLANEDLENGLCERCGSMIEKKRIRQWVLRITDYAERLLNDLEELKEWPEHIKELQRNWIGKSDGAEIEFGIVSREEKIKIFTTRPDTLFGVTYMVLAPEHPLVEKLKSEIKNWDEVEAYIHEASHRTEIERTAEGKEKTGVLLEGIKAINPANKEEIPIFIADYVLADYGTGAIMAVPAHDERDWEFATKVIPKETAESFKKYVRHVIEPVNLELFITSIRKRQVYPFMMYRIEIGIDEGEIRNAKDLLRRLQADELCYLGDGRMVNSGDLLADISNEEAKKKITEFVGGKMKTTYKLRDWVFSRQRYWGEPIPLVFCNSCKIQAGNSKFEIRNSKFSKGELLNPGWIEVSEKDLPVVLPEVESYEPTGTGESPLANISEWVNVSCPKCGGKGKRETNTMPQWAGSSWYYLRYIDSKNSDVFVDKKKEKYWSPVDVYVGGAEHATRHLIYARFWHKFLYDRGFVSHSEPFRRLKSPGLIAGADGRKMSKRFGNVINPDDIVNLYGADTFRLYEMFMGPFEQGAIWSEESIIGSRRFIEKVWRLKDRIINNESVVKNNENEIEGLLHQTIKKISKDIEQFRFNTAISAMMIFINQIEAVGGVSRELFALFIKLLAPFTPHLAEELWRELFGNKTSIHLEKWPKYDESKIISSGYTITVQVNGKVRDTLETDTSLSLDEARSLVLAREKIKKWTDGKKINKVIYIKNKLINFVISSD